MNAAAVTQRSIEAVNDVLKQTNTEVIKQASKMVKVANEIKLGPGTGNGNTIDLSA